MKKEKDPHKKSVLDSRQNSIKLLMNSLYGFMKGRKLPDKRCMEAVTAEGRNILEKIKKLVESTFKGCKVIYGDTDSVFVKFPGVDMQEAFRLGQEAADLCTEMLNEHRKAAGKEYIHKLQREKGFNPFLSVGKKKYAGRRWMTLDQPEPEFASSGLETVRRDNALIGSETQENALKMLIMEGDLDGKRATKYIHEQIEKLLHGKIEMSKLIISKALSKTFEHYEKKGGKQPHVQLAKKIDARKHKTGEVGYNTGDRVKFVIVQGPKNKQKKTDVAECAEDPLYALQNRLNIDYEYYLWQQMMKPLLRIFTPIFSPKGNIKTIHGLEEERPVETMKKKKGKGKDKDDLDLNELKKLTAFKVLFTGKHMRSMVQKADTNSSVGIAKFTVKQDTCISCNTRVEKNGLPLCRHCEPKRQITYLTLMNEKRQLEDKRWACWVGCQQCVGEKYSHPIECAQKDCSNFYERQKVLYDIEDLDKKLNKFY